MREWGKVGTEVVGDLHWEQQGSARGIERSKLLRECDVRSSEREPLRHLLSAVG